MIMLNILFSLGKENISQLALRYCFIQLMLTSQRKYQKSPTRAQDRQLFNGNETTPCHFRNDLEI